MGGCGFYHCNTKKADALQRYGEEHGDSESDPSFAQKYALRELWAVIQSIIGTTASACYTAAFWGDFEEGERVGLINNATWIALTSFLVGILVGICCKKDSGEPTVWEVNSDDEDSLLEEISLFSPERHDWHGSAASLAF